MRALVVFTCVAACASRAPRDPHGPSPVVPAAELMVRVESFSCLGWCPDYRLDVYRDGLVVFRGASIVVELGWRWRRIDAAAVTAIDALLDQARAIDRSEPCQVTDNGGVVLTLGSVDAVRLVQGCGPGSFDLHEVAERIVAAAAATAWIGSDAAHRALWNDLQPRPR